MNEPAYKASGDAPAPAPAIPDPRRRIGRVNWLGVWTLYVRETYRFLKLPMQTILAPLITTLLFLAIFSLAFGERGGAKSGIAFTEFLAPGLIMMAIIQNSFANSATSLLISKIQGNIIDVLMPPLTPAELLFAYALSGATRGIVVALAVALGMFAFVELRLSEPWAVLYFGLGAALLMSIIGVISGIWADKFDHMATVTNFAITPLVFLSGTFYSVERLPDLLKGLSQANPIFYLIDGFRYGFIGAADGRVLVGAVMLALLNFALWGLALRLLKSGWRLKS